MAETRSIYLDDIISRSKMLSLGYVMLFRKGQTFSAILAVTLLVAVPASVSSAVNHVNLQTEALASFVNIRGTYLLLSGNSTHLTDSRIDADLARQLEENADVKRVLPQRILKATLIASSGNYTVAVRGLEDVGIFLGARGSRIDGVTARKSTEANIGEVLAQMASVKPGDTISLAVYSKLLRLRVVGIARAVAEVDCEVMVPFEALNPLVEEADRISFIEFTLKEKIAQDEAINRMTRLLPKDVRIVEVQQTKQFIHAINSQTLAFLNVWSVAIYGVVAVASYVTAARFSSECRYELMMLRILGSRKRHAFTLIFAYTISTTLLGSILGIALGIVAAQTFSTALKWILPGAEVMPFLEPGQALQILILAIASSTPGSTYAALRSARTEYLEEPL